MTDRPTLPRLLVSVAAVVFGAILPVAAARAQDPCSPHWLPGDGIPGVDGSVYALTTWDPDGPGPQTPKLVIGGQFTLAGNVPANNIALYDLATGVWSPLGAGITGGNHVVYALAVLASGDLVAGGQFTTAGGALSANIARWNGSAWTAIGTGLNGRVLGLAAMPNGELVAGGAFTAAGGASARRIARWNGSTWTPMGTGMNDLVYALAVLPSGDLVAGGAFVVAGAVRANRIARWNGAAWSRLGAGMSGDVRALTVLHNGDLVAGGFFSSAGGVSAYRVARWNGTAWSPLGAGLHPHWVYTLAVLPNGDLVAGGSFKNTGGDHVARWNGSTWSSMGTGLQYDVNAFAVLPGGDLVAGGSYDGFLGEPADHLARWDGSEWARLGTGISNAINALAVLPGGDLVASGNFTTASGVHYVARWNGSDWSRLGTGMSDSVFALAVLPNGDVVAGGAFTFAGGVHVNHIARWNPGAPGAWSPFGTGMNDSVQALAVLPSGDLVAGGYFTTAGGVPASNIARWDGSAWNSLGAGVAGGPQYLQRVEALAVLPSGDLIAGGYFTTAGEDLASNIARWNGSAWFTLGAGVSASDPYDQAGYVYSLAVLPNGDLIAGGSFTMAGLDSAVGIARWNGSGWSPLGAGINGLVRALAILPGGDLIAGGYFTTAGGISANRVARWNGSTWSTLDSGLTGGPVRALASLPSGDLVAGGEFNSAGGAVSAYSARYVFSGPVIAAASPPTPLQNGGVPFREVLQNTDALLSPQGIGAPGTPSEGAVTYAPISVTFNCTPAPAPSPGNIILTCTDGDCPNITAVSGSGAGPYLITLSSAIPPRECTTIGFTGTLPGQRLQYQSLPGDVNLNGTTNGQDVITLVLAINQATATPLSRYDINRNGVVTGQDVVRLVQLLNGGLSVLPSTGYNNATVAACP